MRNMEEDLCDSENLDFEISDVEMPLFKWGSKKESRSADSVNYKSKVEQKLLMARQDPEPVFDLTECNLLDVPTGVYSWCKVCLKQRLLLQNNRLKSIRGGGNIKDLFNLQMLELSHNCLSKLPEEIGLLPNLQAIYLQFNRLKEIPSSFSQLKNLQILNLKGNCLKTFPTAICLLPSLVKLDISSNSINQLPNSFSNLTKLNELVIDSEIYDYPESDICMQGLKIIMEFICQKTGKEYSPPSSEVNCSYSLDSAFGSAEQAMGNPIGHQQEQRQQALLEREKSLVELYERLSHSQSSKDSFLKGLIEDQDRLDVELSNAQNKKDESRQKLLQELMEVEKESNFAIEELLELSKLNRTNDALLESLENDRREFDFMTANVQNESSVLSRKEVMEAMENTLENQYREARNNLAAYNWAQKELLAETQLNELSQAAKLEEIITKCEEDQASLIAELLQDEEYQKRAFENLLKRKDTEYTRLSDQISLIENELANLTVVEMRRQDLKVQTEKSLLEDQRGILTSLLVQLVEQQENRSKAFQNRVQEIEARKSQEQADFWLRQYQRLLESKPSILQQQEVALDDRMKLILRRAGAWHVASLFANRNINLREFRRMTELDLIQLGIGDGITREAILRELRGYNSQRSQAGQSTKLRKDRRSSLRARFELECVVCMERMCSVIYLNCGHVCCCTQCAGNFKTCPMCRATIERIFLLNYLPSAPSLDA